MAVVIPVYNHGATLREVVTRTLAVHNTVIVVDDGSQDTGPDTLRGLAVYCIRHARNRGKGAAILSGAQKARRLGMTHIITVDADGQHRPEDLLSIVKEINRDPHAIVVGKRDFEGHYAPPASRVGRRISNFWFLMETGRSIGDAQSGYRAYPLNVLRSLTLRERRYTFEIEVLVKAAWAGVPIREVVVSIFYSRLDDRISHFHLFRDNVRLSALNARLFLRALLVVPHKKVLKTKGP